MKAYCSLGCIAKCSQLPEESDYFFYRVLVRLHL